MNASTIKPAQRKSSRGRKRGRSSKAAVFFVRGLCTYLRIGVQRKCLALCACSLSAYSSKDTPVLCDAHHLRRVGVHEERAMSVRWAKTLDLTLDTATSCVHDDTHACST